MEKTGSIFQSGTAGINRGLKRLDATANNIARAGTINKSADTTDVAKELVDLKKEKLDIQASAKVLKTADEILGSFLDEFA